MHKYGEIIVSICGLCCLALLSCGLGKAISSADMPMTLNELYASKGIPSECGSEPGWVGRQVIFKGYVDSDNIIDRSHYPDLAYEKFGVTDRQGRALEVWVNASDSRPFFSKVFQKAQSQIIIKGRLAAVTLPVMGDCKLTAKVWIDDPSQIQ